MKKIELKQYIKECIDEVLAEDQAFGESAIHENTLLERWEKIVTTNEAMVKKADVDQYYTRDGKKKIWKPVNKDHFAFARGGNKKKLGLKRSDTTNEAGPARIARQTSGIQSQDQGRDPLARKNPGLNRLAKGATDRIVSYQRKSGKIASRDQRVPFKDRPRVGSIKKIGEYRTNIGGGRGDVPPPKGPVKRTNISGGYGGKKYNSQPPRTGLKPRPDDSFAVKKNSPMGAIEKVKRKLRGEAVTRKIVAPQKKKVRPYGLSPQGRKPKAPTQYKKPLTQKEREFMKRSYNDEQMSNRTKVDYKDPNKNNQR